MRKIWSEEEIEILKNNWSDNGRPQILSKLPNKRWTSIRHKAAELGLTKIPPAKYWKTYNKQEPLKLSDAQRGYLAGIIDGEGTIRIVKTTDKYYAPFIQITNTNMAIMEYLERVLGDIGHLYIENPNLRKPNHKTKLVFNLASVQGVKAVLEGVADLLVIKKSQGKLALDFIRYKESKRGYGNHAIEEDFHQKMLRLNARGSE